MNHNGGLVPIYSLGLDFGTESVRALVVDIHTGAVAAQAEAAYRHGVIDRVLPVPGGPAALPADYALQHPGDWLTEMSEACRRAIADAGVAPEAVVGIGVDFTSCTMLPVLNDGTPLCLAGRFSAMPLAWPRLWKHHGAKAQTDRINQIARQRGESWLDRYGGAIGLEWFFPKVLEALENAPAAYHAAELWLEAGDWLVWQLTSGPFPNCAPGDLVRSTCQAGYKAMWNTATGYPSSEYFGAVHPDLANVVETRMAGRLDSPGRKAGGLSAASAKLLGLLPGTPVSVAIIDAHAGVPGSGVAEPDALVMVMGTSSCHMMNSRLEKMVPGVAGVVDGGILPGFFGYETGQAAVGDAFAWVAKTLGQSHAELTSSASALPPGAGGVMALDWLNGCRTPLMNGRLSGAYIGLTLSTSPAQLYRAMLEATVFGLKWIVDTLIEAGVPVRRFVASGGLPGKSPLLMQIVADVLGQPIELAASDQSVALGAAILGCLAAGPAATGHQTHQDAIRAMARTRDDLVYRPDAETHGKYAAICALYRQLGRSDGPVAEAMRRLREGA